MGIGNLTDRSAIEKALEEFLEIGREAFLAKHKFGASTDYFVTENGYLFDAKAIAGVALNIQYPHLEPVTHDDFSGGVQGANAALKKLGFTIIRRRNTAVDDERRWRLAVWDHLQQLPDGPSALAPKVLHSYGVYGGGQGIWVDADRTKSIAGSDPAGIAVGVLHTGVHYPDELGPTSLIYHYPHTKRRGKRDESEVNATKAAAALRIPMFIITKPSRSATVRTVRLAWVEGWDDKAATFLITYGATPPSEIITADRSDTEAFNLEGNRSKSVRQNVRRRPDQQRFKFMVMQRYGSTCPLSDISVPQMIEAAHLRPDADGGSADPRNGLPLNAALHRAFDAHLFGIHPDTLEVEVRPDGPTLAAMGITKPHLRDMAKKPHPDALRWRYDLWQEQLAKS